MPISLYTRTKTSNGWRYHRLNRYASLMPGWIGQTATNSAMGQYILKLAKLAGVKTLNVVSREEAAEQVRRLGGDRVVLQGDNLAKDTSTLATGLQTA